MWSLFLVIYMIVGTHDFRTFQPALVNEMPAFYYAARFWVPLQFFQSHLKKKKRKTTFKVFIKNFITLLFIHLMTGDHLCHGTLLHFYSLFYHIGLHMSWHPCGGQRTTCWNQFSLSRDWIWVFMLDMTSPQTESSFLCGSWPNIEWKNWM